MIKGRPQGGTNKYWSAEEKYKVIKPILDCKLTSGEVTTRIRPLTADNFGCGSGIFYSEFIHFSERHFP